MILGVGVDIAKNKRFASWLRNEKKILRFFHKKEIDFSKITVQMLASRFAAKEAFSKALGTGIGKELSFQDIEILPNKQNKPVIKTENYSGAVHLSISHSKNAAIAQVILENN